ncbi:MAG TPA: nicotinate (nicotinamide) nucleotide adenylyltransferase [Tepidisphaeraceae bacterium]|nr:nicotinate (nicotinamide) nucleotide adenylyltransferase [Tepidisphaeraceae bacterium]
MHNLCFGGSFNPIHNGHLICSQAVAGLMDVTELVLIPSAISPHKLGHADMAAAGDRLAMCRLAVAGNALFEVDDLELRRGPPSYTIDTVRELRRARGWSEVNWLIGADQVPTLPRWREPTALLREVRLVIIARPGWSFDWHTLPPELRVLQNHVVEAPLVEISSTDIRRRVRAGEPIDHLTPPAVAQYIRERDLYRA